MQGGVLDVTPMFDGHPVTPERFACLSRLDRLGACEVDKSLGGEAVAVFAQCRRVGWVGVCRDADGSITLGRKFGAVYQLSSVGREVLHAYRAAMMAAPAAAPCEPGDAYATLMRDWLARPPRPKSREVIRQATGGI